MYNELTPVFIEFVPEILENGKLYVSMEYESAIHLCPCGCNNKVVTPFGKGGWKLINNNGLISLNPSIGNWQWPCKTHYYINNNKIDYCP